MEGTFTQARALTTRRALALRLSLFTIGCFSHREDPRRCTIGVVLSFLQEKLERRLSLSIVLDGLQRGPFELLDSHSVVNLEALPSEEADPALALRFPVRALRIYVERTRSLRSSEQLLVCYEGQQKGKSGSKQRLPGCNNK